MDQTAQKKQEKNEDLQGQKSIYSDNHIDLEMLSSRHRREYLQAKPIFDSLGIEFVQEGVSDKPDFRFAYEDKNIGLEATCCYPPDALIHKNNKDQNKYEIGDKGVRLILKKYERYKIERREWVSLFIGFYNGLYYALRDTSLTKKDIEEIGNEVIEEIENRIEDYHRCKRIDKNSPELRDKHYKYVSDILWDEPQEGKVLLGCGGHAKPARTIEIDPLRNAILNKERKLAEYKQLEQNKGIDEYWLCVNLPIPSERLLFDLEPFKIQSEYTRVYVTQFTYALQIK